MTDNLLYKLEEKMVSLLTELENLRKEVSKVKQENATLKTDQIKYGQKLQDILSLLDSLDAPLSTSVVHDLEMFQNKESFATA